MRKTGNDSPDRIDGNDKPAQRFCEVYESLYNSTGDNEGMNSILNEINSKICQNDLIEIDRVTSNVISDAVEGIKSSKKDPVFTFNSDCIKQVTISASS